MWYTSEAGQAQLRQNTRGRTVVYPMRLAPRQVTTCLHAAAGLRPGRIVLAGIVRHRALAMQQRAQPKSHFNGSADKEIPRSTNRSENIGWRRWAVPCSYHGPRADRSMSMLGSVMPGRVANAMLQLILTATPVLLGWALVM